MARKSARARFSVPEAEALRAEIGASEAALAAAAGLPPRTVAVVLAGGGATFTMCRKTLRGLQRLGSKAAATAEIVKGDLRKPHRVRRELNIGHYYDDQR